MSKKPKPQDTPGASIDKLVAILEYLRTDPEGCAWTREQTHPSLARHLIEEAYETAETLDGGRHGNELRDELGDLLLQIVFHAEIARGRGAFTFEDVAKSIVDKLVRRYPTILGDESNTLKTPEEIDRRWEEIKAEERKAKGIREDASILDEVSHALPALLRSAKLKGRAAKEGWEWPDVQMLFDKIEEEVAELKEEVFAGEISKERLASEMGDLMFMIVDLGRWHGIDAEDALRTTNIRFETRFRYMESAIKAAGSTIPTMPVEKRRALWDEAKRVEKQKKS